MNSLICQLICEIILVKDGGDLKSWRNFDVT